MRRAEHSRNWTTKPCGAAWFSARSNSFEPVTMAEAELQILEIHHRQNRGLPRSAIPRRHRLGVGAPGDAGKHRDDRRAKTICPASPRLAAAAGARRTVCRARQCRRLRRQRSDHHRRRTNSRLEQRPLAPEKTMDARSARRPARSHRRSAALVRTDGARKRIARHRRQPPKKMLEPPGGNRRRARTTARRKPGGSGARRRMASSRGSCKNWRRTFSPPSRLFTPPTRNAPASAAKNCWRRSNPIPIFWRRRRNRCFSRSNSNATALCWRGPVGTRGFRTATSACATRSPRNCSRPAGRRRAWRNWPPR